MPARYRSAPTARAALRRQRIADDGGLAAAQDAGLLAADGLAVVSEELGVVDVDAGQHRAVGIEDVDRVEAAAEADLEDAEVERRGREQPGNHQERELEIGECDVAAGRLDRFEVRQQRLGRHALAGDPAALLEMHQVRLGEEPDPIAGSERDRLEHGAGRALAVGAADDHDRRRRIEVQAEPGLDRRDAVERQLDRLRMQALAVGEPIG
jgi:hypothetical protein